MIKDENRYDSSCALEEANMMHQIPREGEFLLVAVIILDGCFRIPPVLLYLVVTRVWPPDRFERADF